MPNANGPHHKGNKGKPLPLPAVTGEIIGYTGDLNDCPTVYFTLGHYTQKHTEDWDVGWDSCAGWECMFFGNVHSKPKRQDGKDADSFHDVQKQPLFSPDDYVLHLKTLGKNRFKGGKVDKLSNWNLDVNLDGKTGGQQLRLREFWIRKGGLVEENRFAHPSRGHFIPVNDVHTKKQLLDQVSKTKGAIGLVAVLGEWTWTS
jgi:hypothetical protein